MRKGTFVVTIALALFALTGTLVFAHDAIVTMNEQNGSGQNGVTSLVDNGDGTTTVTIEISNGTDTPQPAHIHEGTCATLNPKPTYPLNTVVNGKSTTIVQADIHDIADGVFAVNVHKSAAEATVYTSCGDVTSASMVEDEPVGMPTTGSNSFDLVIGALALLAATLLGVGLKLSRNNA